MYRILRNTHLFLGLFCCLFLLMYGVSSVQMAHNGWFTTRPTVTNSEAALRAGAVDARVIGRDLIDQQGLRGEISQIRSSPERISFSITRPGTVYQVDYSPANGRTIVRENRAGLIGMLNRIHHVGGLWHEYLLINVWAGFMGIVAAALIVLALTGIYLWFKIHTERVAGLILLAISLGYSLTLMVLARRAW